MLNVGQHQKESFSLGRVGINMRAPLETVLQQKVPNIFQYKI